ncbi:MAG: hypothetical protein AABY15_08655, partial [Nanoarchaeota archaeon]
ISAVQIETKDGFSQGETLIAKISGNFVDPLGNGNILFYRGHVRVPTQFALSKINEDYYLYALLSGKTAGNYSLQIQGVKYKVATQVKDDDIIRNFTITNETADFYVAPGFLKASDNFSLELTNLKDNSIEIEVVSENSTAGGGFFSSLFGTGSNTQTVTLSSGQTKKVNFGFAANLNESTLRTINLTTDSTSYSIPVYMEIKNVFKEIEGTGELTFEPLLFNVSIATNSNTSRVIYLFNKKDLPVKNISLYVSEELQPYVNLSVTEVDEMDENSSMRIDLWISSGENEENFNGQITASYENASGTNSEELFTQAEIFLNFIEDYVPKYEENITVISTKTCSEINGTICNATTETCSGESVYAKENKCCTGACTPIAESSSTGKYIGWGLVGLVVIFVLWFLIKRYKKTSTAVDLL